MKSSLDLKATLAKPAWLPRWLTGIDVRSGPVYPDHTVAGKPAHMCCDGVHVRLGPKQPKSPMCPAMHASTLVAIGDGRYTVVQQLGIS